MKKYPLYLLIGPKGAGKSYIGTKLAEMYCIEFFKVEQIWIDLQKTRSDHFSTEFIKEGRIRTIEALDQKLIHGPVIMEATGAGDDWGDYYNKLEARFQLICVKVAANLDTCFKRISQRDSSLQANVSWLSGKTCGKAIQKN